MKNRIIFPLLVMLFFSCGGKSNNTGLGLNVFQLGESHWTLNQKNTLKKKPFSLVFSFPNIPEKADTNISIYYWATTDKSMLSKFKKAKKLEDLGVESGGVNVSSNNDDETLVIDMEGYKAILVEKKGSKGEISHGFTNLDRVGNRIDGWYKISQIYDCKTQRSTPIKNLKANQLFIYYSVRSNVTFKESEGRFVELYFK